MTLSKYAPRERDEKLKKIIKNKLRTSNQLHRYYVFLHYPIGQFKYHLQKKIFLSYAKQFKICQLETDIDKTAFTIRKLKCLLYVIKKKIVLQWYLNGNSKVSCMHSWLKLKINYLLNYYNLAI